MKPHSCLRVLGLAVLVGPISSFAQDEKTLQGGFEVIKAERDGKAAPDVIGHVLTLAGDDFEIKVGDKLLFKGTYKIDKSNKEIWDFDITHTLGELKGKKWLGIMRIMPDGLLEICDNAVDPSKPRPEKFATAPDSGAILLIFKRK